MNIFSYWWPLAPMKSLKRVFPMRQAGQNVQPQYPLKTQLGFPLLLRLPWAWGGVLFPVSPSHSGPLEPKRWLPV